MTVSGEENTLIVLTPPRGCQYGCDFCGVKDLQNPNFAVQGKDGVIAAQTAAVQVEELLASHPETATLKLFNAGNILYGTERRNGAEMNEAFWPALIDALKRHPEVHAVELEVRIDEFVGSGENAGSHEKTNKGILRDRLLWLDRELKAIGKRLRCILPLEYIESDIISQQSKFPPVFTNEGRSKANSEEAVAFVKQHGIEWLSYAMLGGRLSERSLEADEAVSSAAHTALFALEHGAREAIINSQYLTPREQWEEKRDGVPYYVPDEAAMRKTLELVVSVLNSLPQSEESCQRVRLTTDKEDAIEGDDRPKVSPEFRQLVLAFNNAPDQVAFFREKMSA